MSEAPEGMIVITFEQVRDVCDLLEHFAAECSSGAVLDRENGFFEAANAKWDRGDRARFHARRVRRVLEAVTIHGARMHFNFVEVMS